MCQGQDRESYTDEQDRESYTDTTVYSCAHCRYTEERLYGDITNLCPSCGGGMSGSLKVDK